MTIPGYLPWAHCAGACVPSHSLLAWRSPKEFPSGSTMAWGAYQRFKRCIKLLPILLYCFLFIRSSPRMLRSIKSCAHQLSLQLFLKISITFNHCAFPYPAELQACAWSDWKTVAISAMAPAGTCRHYLQVSHVVSSTASSTNTTQTR